MNALLLLSLALIIGGINLLITLPAGKALLSAGAAAMVILGLGGCFAIWIHRREGWRPLNSARKMQLGGAAFLITIFGVAMTVMSAGDLKWAGSGLQTVCFALMFLAGILSLLLLINTQKETLMEGFFFITGEPYRPRWGFMGLRHIYEGERNGIPLKIEITAGSPDRHGTPRYVLNAECLIDNPHGIALLAYPEHFYGWPPVPFLPRIPHVPHWSKHVVRGRPAALISVIIARFRKHPHTIFSDHYGFERVQVSDNLVRGRFVLDTGEKHRIIDIIEGLVFFSGHFN